MLALDVDAVVGSLEAKRGACESSPDSLCTVSVDARAPDGTVVGFDATLCDPTLCRDDCSDQSSVRPYMDDFVPTPLHGKRPVDASFSSVSDDGADLPLLSPLCTPHKYSNHKPRSNHVKFESQVYEIPTMENLHRQVLTAQSDRSQLWLGVSDLNEQIRRLRLQLHSLQTAVQSQPHHKCACVPPAGVSHCSADAASRSAAKSGTNKVGRRRRRVVLDGDALARTFAEADADAHHASSTPCQFDCRGITSAIDYYAARGCRAVAVVSERTWGSLRAQAANDKKAMRQLGRLDDLKSRRMLYTCPSSSVRKRDFLLQYALDHDAQVVANSFLSSEDESSTRIPQAVVTGFMFIDGNFVPQRGDDQNVQSATSERDRRWAVRRSAKW